MIDDQRLRAAAWARFHTVRKRMEKASRDLRRHEEIDLPAYQQWLYRMFPTLVTRLRDLQHELATKARQIHSVQARAFYFGGTPKRIWREQKEREAHPERFEDEREPGPAEERSHHEARPEEFAAARGPAPSLDARAIYRRLVQRLHPDRGGAWTATRERLWHEVQLAWAAADADWLARLEVDWESAHDVLGPNSPLSRLQRAIAELDAARRDTERKLRAYRSDPAWRFSRSERTRDALHRRLEREFADELRLLERQLEHFNRTIAAWEEDWTKPRSRRRS